MRAIKDGETSKGLPQQRPPSAQARAQRPRPSHARPDQARAAEVTAFKAPPGSSATRPRVRSPVPVVAPPPRGNTPEGWISRSGGSQSAYFRRLLGPAPLRSLALALGAVAPSGAECSPACGGARFLPSEHSRDTAAAGVGFMRSARRAGPRTPPPPSSRAGRVLRLP